MKANLPTSWHKLPEREKRAISEAAEREIRNRVDREHARVQEVWIKMMCIVEANIHKFNEEQLSATIAYWKRLYRRIERMETNAEVDAYLDNRLKEAFPTMGFPQTRIEELKNMGKNKR